MVSPCLMCMSAFAPEASEMMVFTSGMSLRMRPPEVMWSAWQCVLMTYFSFKFSSLSTLHTKRTPNAKKKINYNNIYIYILLRLNYNILYRHPSSSIYIGPTYRCGAEPIHRPNSHACLSTPFLHHLSLFSLYHPTCPSMAWSTCPPNLKISILLLQHRVNEHRLGGLRTRHQVGQRGGLLVEELSHLWAPDTEAEMPVPN